VVMISVPETMHRSQRSSLNSLFLEFSVYYYVGWDFLLTPFHPQTEGSHDLLSLMILPVQRLPRYILLLKDLFSHTSKVLIFTKLIGERVFYLNEI
jgi:hypothetical protein